MTSCGGNIAPVDGMGGVTLTNVCPHCNCFPLDGYIWWVSTEHGNGNNRKKRSIARWCAACGGQYEWRAPDRILVVQIGTDANEAKVFRTHAAPWGLCDNLINDLKRSVAEQSRKVHCPKHRASRENVFATKRTRLVLAQGKMGRC